MKRRLRLGLAASLLLVSLWMSYDNVLSDIEPIQAQATTAACAVEKCTEEHGVTKIARYPWGQSFEITWRKSVVEVECHRELWVAGSRRCTPTVTAGTASGPASASAAPSQSAAPKH